MKRILVLLALALVAAGCGASAAPSAQVGSAALVVSGGETPKSYTIAELKALPQAQAQFGEVLYVGVSVMELLGSAGFKPEEVRSVKAIASDGFSATYDASQFMRADLIVAFGTVDGELSKNDGGLRTVLPDAEGKMNVRSLTELQVGK